MRVFLYINLREEGAFLRCLLPVFTGVAQLAEQWSPKPLVVGSSPTARANKETMSQITNYIKESYSELVTKVTWPTWKELQESSVLVFVASLLIAGVVFVMDWAFGVNSSDSIWKGVVGSIYDLFQNDLQTMSEIEKKWYVVRAVSGQENRVKETIETEVAAAGLQDYVGQVLIPIEKVFQIRKGKKVSKEKNLFPGYVYIEAALVGEIPHLVKNVTNVIGFLGA